MLEKVTSVSFDGELIRPFHITYINNFSYVKLRAINIEGFTHIGVDGVLFKNIYNFFSGRKKIRRTSFDFTSNAPQFFGFVERNRLKTCFIGGSDAEISNFQSMVEGLAPDHEAFAFYSGFPLDNGFSSWEVYLDHIGVSKFDVVVLGLGTPLQEEIGMLIMESDDNVSTVTCGGFISQCSINNGFQYWPHILDKLNLRWPYRMIKEPHVLRRLVFDYPCRCQLSYPTAFV